MAHSTKMLCRLGDSLVASRAASTNLVDDEHKSILAEGGKIRPELVVGDGLLTFSAAGELEEDETSNEVDDDEDREADVQMRVSIEKVKRMSFVKIWKYRKYPEIPFGFSRMVDR